MIIVPYALVASRLFAADPAERVTLGTLVQTSNSFGKVRRPQLTVPSTHTHAHAYATCMCMSMCPQLVHTRPQLAHRAHTCHCVLFARFFETFPVFFLLLAPFSLCALIAACALCALQVFAALSIISENWGGINEWRSCVVRLREFEAEQLARRGLGRGLIRAIDLSEIDQAPSADSTRSGSDDSGAAPTSARQQREREGKGLLRAGGTSTRMALSDASR